MIAERFVINSLIFSSIYRKFLLLYKKYARLGLIFPGGSIDSLIKEGIFFTLEQLFFFIEPVS